jgi:NitT/TauT family transport system substrate-binding protein
MDINRRQLLAGFAAATAMPLALATGARAGDQLAEAPAIKGDGGTVRLLVNMAGTQSFPPYIIKSRGLDKKFGFTLETIPSTNTQSTTTGFQSGSAELGIYGWNDLSRVKAGGVNVTGIAPFLGWANTVVVPVDSPIKNLGDLRGKKVGVYSRTGLDWVVMRAVALKKYNLDLQKDVVIQEGAVSLLRGLMEQGSLDATQMFNDLTAPMVVSGKFRVLTPIKQLVDDLGLPDTPFLLYAVDAGYAAKHPENVTAFLAAYRESIDILETDDGVWLARGKELNMTDAAVVAKLREVSRPMLMKSFRPTDEANIRKLWAILLATAGAETLGMSQLVDGFMTMKYQEADRA